MTIKKFFFLALILTLTGFGSFAQIGEETPPSSGTEPKYDIRIKNKLDSLGIKYSIAESGNFKVVLDIGEAGRTQLVLIYSKTYAYKGLEVREIKSVAARKESKDEFDANTLFTVLEANQTYKLGAWQIYGGTAPFLLEFALRISANSSQTVLNDLMRLAANTADEMEIKLTNGGDKY